MSIPQTPPDEPTRITVVESEACHLCEDAHRTLAELAATHRITVDTMSVGSEAGQRLTQSHRASMSPLVLVDGKFFSHGRLPRGKLAKALDQRNAAASSSAGVD